MSAFYYIAASLPFLKAPDQNPPLSSLDLLETFESLMDVKDYQELAGVDSHPEKNKAGGVAQKFCLWETSLRKDLLEIRARELNLPPDPYRRDLEALYGTSSIADEAMKMVTPLEIELFLNKHRWSKVDELASGHFFDMEFFRGYRLKIQLQERQAMFNKERGSVAYNNLYGQILEKIGEARS